MIDKPSDPFYQKTDNGLSLFGQQSRFYLLLRKEILFYLQCKEYVDFRSGVEMKINTNTYSIPQLFGSAKLSIAHQKREKILLHPSFLRILDER